MSGLNRVGLYALGLLVEEMGEALVVIGRALRFGFDTPDGQGRTPRDGLTHELGDVRSATDYAVEAGLVSRGGVALQSDRKTRRLTDPKERDNLGRRLAPDPRSEEQPVSDSSR
ncbi:MAG: hypothetical protein ACJ8DZ_13755 [Allosphingosinicella sp.]